MQNFNLTMLKVRSHGGLNSVLHSRFHKDKFNVSARLYSSSESLGKTSGPSLFRLFVEFIFLRL